MAAYFWDLGFDFNAVQNNGTSYLQNGFVLLNAGIKSAATNVPATPVNLSANDTVSFNVFNVTSQPTGTFTVNSGNATFQNADSTTSATQSPFSGSTSFSIFPTGTTFPLSSTLSGPSVIFSGIQANNTSATQSTFPVYSGAQFTVENNGSFLMQATVVVTQTSASGTSQRTFTVDPEMIIGGAG